MKKCPWCKKTVADAEKFCSRKCREKKKAYSQRPDVKEKMKAYFQRPDVKEKMKAYFQRPDVKDRDAKKKITAEYRFLMGLKRRNQRQQIRLLALAEYFGRDYEEWQTEDEKTRDIELKAGEKR